MQKHSKSRPEKYIEEFSLSKKTGLKTTKRRRNLETHSEKKSRRVNTEVNLHVNKNAREQKLKNEETN